MPKDQPLDTRIALNKVRDLGLVKRGTMREGKCGLRYALIVAVKGSLRLGGTLLMKVWFRLTDTC